MKICYYAFYFTTSALGNDYQNPDEGGHTLTVNHKNKTFTFYENTIDPEAKYKEDFKDCDFYINQQSNTSVRNLRDALLKDGYKEIAHIEDEHPWSRHAKEKENEAH